MRLIDADELLKAVDKEREYLLARCQTGAEHILVHNFRDLIDNAPTVIPEDFMHPYEEGYERARKDFERPQGNCENCDFRKFTETFVDGVVELMNKNGITSVEQLSELLKGRADMRGEEE